MIGTLEYRPLGGILMKRSALFLVVVTAALITVPQFAVARDAKTLRIGAAALSPLKSQTRVAFLKRMSELGYEQGRNFAFEFVRAQNSAGFVRAYRELVTRKVDLLLACGQEICLKSALAAAGNLPIVMVAVDYDPIARGYVQSLARPGTNVTGVTFRQITLTKKRLQLMKEAFPDRKAMSVFWDWVSADQWRAVQTAAVALGYAVQGIELHKRPYDFDRAFAQVTKEHRGALMVLASPIFKFPERRRLPDFALRQRIPTMFFDSSYVKAGGLMSYGVSFEKLFRRAADYADKIAKGAKPADLPIEQASQFELVINLKTAEALGITIPRALLLRADEVIE